MSAQGTIRESLLAGDEWTQARVRDELHINPSNLTHVLRKMRSEGYTFVERMLDGPGNNKPRAWRVVGRPPVERTVVTDLGDLPDVATPKPAPKPAPTPARQSSRQSSHHESMALAPPAPEFGGNLKVVLLSEGEDGTITVGLRNGKVTYVAELVGAHINTQEAQQ